MAYITMVVLLAASWPLSCSSAEQCGFESCPPRAAGQTLLQHGQQIDRRQGTQKHNGIVAKHSSNNFAAGYTDRSTATDAICNQFYYWAQTQNDYPIVVQGYSRDDCLDYCSELTSVSGYAVKGIPGAYSFSHIEVTNVDFSSVAAYCTGNSCGSNVPRCLCFPDCESTAHLSDYWGEAGTSGSWATYAKASSSSDDNAEAEEEECFTGRRRCGCYHRRRREGVSGVDADDNDGCSAGNGNSCDSNKANRRRVQVGKNATDCR